VFALFAGLFVVVLVAALAVVRDLVRAMRAELRGQRGVAPALFASRV
jgi:hypothetical protein